MGGHIDPAEERPSRGRDHPRGEHPGGGCLPGTVGPEQAEDLTGLDVEVELVDRGEVRPRIDLGQVLGMDDRVPRAVRSLPSGPWPSGNPAVAGAPAVLIRHIVTPGQGPARSAEPRYAGQSRGV